MAKMSGKSTPTSVYIGHSVAGAKGNGPSGGLMDGSKTPISRTSGGLTGGGTPKPSVTKHGSGLIARAKTAL